MQRNTSERVRGPVPTTGQWCEHASPFRHFSASNVFADETYQHLCREFSHILGVTAGEREGQHKLIKIRKNYDALILGINDALADKFAPLFNESWLRPISEFLGMKFVPRVEGALHSNPQGSQTGWIHTDLCSGWFDESNHPKEQLLFPPRHRCEYFTGIAKALDAEPVEYIRAATMIFYLCNDDWDQGDGGETGLYGASRDTENTETKLFPPVNNTLLLFECSPHSYHRFVANPGRTRNSIILWLHADVDDAVARWGTAINRPSCI